MGQTPDTTADWVVADTALPPDLRSFAFQPAAGAGSLKGIFLDKFGRQVGPNVNFATSNFDSTMYDVWASANPSLGRIIPSNVVGFYGSTSAILRFNTSVVSETQTIATATDGNCPTWPIGAVQFGRVNNHVQAIVATSSGGGGGGGGGAATIADGADVAEGTTTDAAYAGSGAASVVAALKGIYARISPTGVAGTPNAAVTSVQGVAGGTAVPVSAASLPLPTGAAQDATLTGGTQQTKITDGTNVANVIAPGSAGQNGQVVVNGNNEVSFTTTSVQVVGLTDCRNYKGFSLQVTSQGTSSTITPQQSNDQVTWYAVPMVLVTNVGATTAVTTTTAVLAYRGNIELRYFRLNVTGISAGTTAGIVEFYAAPFGGIAPGAAGVNASQSGTWTVQPGNTANTTPWNVTTGGTTTAAIAASTAANTVVKGSAGRLFRVLVTTTGANPMLIYDNATTNSGTIIGALPATPAVGSVYDFEMPAANGIVVAGSATNPGVTISYSN